MSEETTFATVRASASDFEQMIRESALSGEKEHDDLYLNILEDRVDVLQSASGEVILSYATFESDYFGEIELEKEIETTTGNHNGSEFEYRVGAAAILNVEDTLAYLDFASDGGTVELTFEGDESNQLATYLRAEGALEAWVKLPGGQAALDRVPQWLPMRFSDDDVYMSPSGSEAPTEIRVDSERIDTIIRAVEQNRDAEYYPITVEDGEFVINVGDEHNSGVRGAITVDSVEGPDVDNDYWDGFEEIFNVLSGLVSLQTGPGNNPMAVVKAGNHRVIRHINASVSR